MAVPPPISDNNPSREAKEFRAGAEHMVDMFIFDYIESDPNVYLREDAKARFRHGLINLVLNAPYKKVEKR